MTEPKQIEYRVVPKTTYEVERIKNGVRSISNGRTATAQEAYDYAYQLAFAERERLGWPPGDERIQFPKRPQSEEAA